jgi:hypothetical protein
MMVTKRSSPPASAFLGDIGSFYHWDSYEAPLGHDGRAMHEIYLALFAHPPRGFTELLILRDRIVAPLGLRPSGAAERKAVEIRPAYTVGEKIARFTLFGQNDTEIVTGGDDTHLDFRVSVRKSNDNGANRVTLTTVVSPHNLLGRTYLSVILPFHRYGVRTLLANAVKAGRL